MKPGWTLAGWAIWLKNRLKNYLYGPSAQLIFSWASYLSYQQGRTRVRINLFREEQQEETMSVSKSFIENHWENFNVQILLFNIKYIGIILQLGLPVVLSLCNSCLSGSSVLTNFAIFSFPFFISAYCWVSKADDSWMLSLKIIGKALKSRNELIAVIYDDRMLIYLVIITNRVTNVSVHFSL